MWNSELPSTNGEEMSRFPSQDSIGAHSQRTTHSSSLSSTYDQATSVRMYPSASQMSFHMSSAQSDVTDRSNSPDNSAIYTPTQPLDLQTYESFSYPSGEDITGSHSLFPGDSEVSSTLEQSFALYASTDDTFVSAVTNGHLPVSQDDIYNTATVMDSPIIWDNGPSYLDSQRSSPVLDEWALPQHLATSTTSSPLEYSANLGGPSPRYVPDSPDTTEQHPYTTSDRVARKPVGPRQSKVVSDLASRNHGLPGASGSPEEALRYVGRPSLETDNTARDHHLYQNVTAQADGLYHCPWEGEPFCQHKPEKLKCNYE